MGLEATNNCVWVIRDRTEVEKNGLIIPTSGQIKPHRGKIISVGELTKDRKIKKGKTAIFHQTVGQEIEVDDVIYLVLAAEHILGVI